MTILAATSLVLGLVIQTPPTPRTELEASSTTVLPRSDAVHGRASELVLPRRRAERQQPQDAAEAAREAAVQHDFLTAVKSLRRSRRAAPAEEFAIVQRIGRDFDRVPERCIDALPAADADTAHGLMRVLVAFGAPEQAAELEFLLQTRPFGNATEIIVATMAEIAREDAATRLLACMTASRPAVRHHAALSLRSRLQPEHAAALVELSRHADADVAGKALGLLGHVPPTPPVRERLLAALSESPLLAGHAVDALIAQGAEEVDDLQAILRRPARGRDTGYAALVLASIEQGTPGLALIDDSMVGPLIAELDVPDPFQRTAVAIALAGAAWRSQETSGERFEDRRVVDALLDVVAPKEFISHLVMLRSLALPRLAMLTGQDFGAAALEWRRWWDGLGAGPDWVGGRQHVALTAEVAEAASLVWRAPERTIVLHGERATPPAAEDGQFVFVVGGEELLAVVERLEALGFMGPPMAARASTDPRSLTLRLGATVARSDPATTPAALDRFGVAVSGVVGSHRWQLYRDVEREPDAVAFWRSETRWLERHPGAEARAERLEDRILRVLPALRGARRTMAVDDLVASPDFGDRLTTADGLALAEAAAASERWDEPAFRLLELAMLAPGDEVWQRLIEVALERDEREATGGAALQRIFSLLGPDRILEALDAEDALVRRVAMDEIARLADLRAAPRLLETALDAEESIDLRRTAVYALGRLRAPEAQGPLIQMIEQGVASAELRRASWIAIARIGGESAFPVLQRAFPTPDEEDRRAIVRALGAMQHPRAATELANIFALRATDSLGALAIEQLRQLGDALASPALVAHVDDRSEAVRRQVALLLGEFQHPAALPALMEMLGEDAHRLRVVSLLAGITGLELSRTNDRVGVLRAWFETNGRLGQGEWLIAALELAGVAHDLRREQVEPGAGIAAVPELARLVLELEQSWLRPLALRVLRLTTGEDFGTINALSPEAQRYAICERYRFLYDSTQAASGR